MPTRSSGGGISLTFVVRGLGFWQAPSDMNANIANVPGPTFIEPTRLIRNADPDKHLLLQVLDVREVAAVRQNRVADAEVAPVADEVVVSSRLHRIDELPAVVAVLVPAGEIQGEPARDLLDVGQVYGLVVRER